MLIHIVVQVTENCGIWKTGGGTPVAEELARSTNKGRPNINGITGAVQSDPGAGSSKQVTLGMCTMHYYLLKVLHAGEYVLQ